ncbi:MAG: flagellar hook protein FlgE [Pseudomonadota bacterium]
MALSSALFSGVSGLSTMGNAMQIIGDNIANVNTVGFKASSFNFQDLLSHATATMSGTAQVGRGTGMGDISAVFSQGTFESTGNSTDLAIGGQGFFIVGDPESAGVFYTRAGNFRFDKDGYMVNPSGYVVQGWTLDPDTGEDEGSVTGIQLSSFTSPPQETDQIDVIVNLNSDGDDASSGSDTKLSEAWKGTTATPPIAENAYEYGTILKVYDSLGSVHDLTLYFDKGATASTYEFIVTCNPSEDMSAPTLNTQTGLLAKGLITFDAGSGAITDIAMDTSDGDGTWTAASLSDGYFVVDPVFITGNSMAIKLNLGASTADAGVSWTPGSLPSTRFARVSTTTFQSANGYGAGDLQGTTVDGDGVITGSYSNGELLPLFRIALAKFTNFSGLKKEGNNLFSETRESGNAITNRSGTNGLGNISPNSLEQSNVDMAAEFVKMITTQRGFQANSKIITTTDQMLSELINLKR